MSVSNESSLANETARDRKDASATILVLGFQ